MPRKKVVKEKPKQVPAKSRKEILKEQSERRARIEGALKMALNSSFDLVTRRKLYQSSYYEFFKWAFKILHPGEPYSDAPHIKELCDHLQKELERTIKRVRRKKDTIINVPPRTSKSLIVSVCFLPWAWTIDPSITMFNISYDDQLVVNNSRLCRDLIKSDEYQELFGHIYQLRKDSDSVTFFKNDKRGSRLAKTTGSSITGHGAKVIIVDDPQSPTTARSEAKRNEINNYLSEDLYNRLTPLQIGMRVYLQQRLHEKDSTGIMLERDGEDSYFHFNMPAVINEETKSKVKPESFVQNYKWINGLGYLDPIRLGNKDLADLKIRVGTYSYNAQYLQDPQAEEGGIIKKAWFNMINPSTFSRDREKEPVHFFVDPAYTEKEANDPTGLLAAFRRGNEAYIVRSESKRLEFPALCKYLFEFVHAYGYDPQRSIIHVEPKASGKSLVQQLKHETSLNIVEDEPPKGDKLTRLTEVSPFTESRRCNVFQGAWNDPFFQQLCNAGEEKWPEHDDEIDVYTMMVRRLFFKNGFDFMFI